MTFTKRSIAFGLLFIPLVAPGGSSIGIGSVGGSCTGLLEGGPTPQPIALTFVESGMNFHFSDRLPELVLEPVESSHRGLLNSDEEGQPGFQLPQACRFQYPSSDGTDSGIGRGDCFFGLASEPDFPSPVRPAVDVEITSPDASGAQISWIQEGPGIPGVLGLDLSFAEDFEHLDVALVVGTELSQGILAGTLRCRVDLHYTEIAGVEAI